VALDLLIVSIDRSGADGATLFRRAGETELKPVTGEHELFDIERDGTRNSP
jgi:hypothetical protein